MTVPSLPALMLEPLVRAALLEDLGRAGDITTDAVVPKQARAASAPFTRKWAWKKPWWTSCSWK